MKNNNHKILALKYRPEKEPWIPGKSPLWFIL